MRCSERLAADNFMMAIRYGSEKSDDESKFSGKNRSAPKERSQKIRPDYDFVEDQSHKQSGRYAAGVPEVTPKS